MGIKSFKYCKLEVLPHEGIGPIKLGHTLFQVIAYVQAQPWGTNVKLAFNKSNPNALPVTVTLPKVGLRLSFDPIYHKLFLIEVTSWTGCEFLYEGISVNSDDAPTFQSIYNKHFGPAYPGYVEQDTDDYVLSYPGIVFRFSLTQQALKKRTSDEKFVQVLHSMGHSIACSGLAIFSGASWKESLDDIGKLLQLSNMQMLRGLDASASLLTWRSARDLLLCDINLPVGIATFKFASKDEFEVRIGRTTMQDVVDEFGKPAEVEEKTFDSKLKIHRLREKSTVANKGVKRVHKYFKYGFDVVYDTTTTYAGSPPVKKLVIHNNMVNSLEFMGYERLNWVMRGYDPDNAAAITKWFADPAKQPTWEKTAREEYLINSCMTYSGFQNKFFKPAPELKNEPVFLDRRQYAINQALVEIQGDDMFRSTGDGNFEVIDFEDDSSDSTKEEAPCSQTPATSESVSDSEDKIIVNDRSKDWGATKLYGFGRCVFEVLIDTDSVSSVTLF